MQAERVAVAVAVAVAVSVAVAVAVAVSVAVGVAVAVVIAVPVAVAVAVTVAVAVAVACVWERNRETEMCKSCVENSEGKNHLVDKVYFCAGNEVTVVEVVVGCVEI
jgi:hypothetical protein